MIEHMIGLDVLQKVRLNDFKIATQGCHLKLPAGICTHKRIFLSFWLPLKTNKQKNPVVLLKYNPNYIYTLLNPLQPVDWEEWNSAWDSTASNWDLRERVQVVFYPPDQQVNLFLLPYVLGISAISCFILFHWCVVWGRQAGL